MQNHQKKYHQGTKITSAAKNPTYLYDLSRYEKQIGVGRRTLARCYYIENLWKNIYENR